MNMQKKPALSRGRYRSLRALGTGKEREYILENLSALLSSGMPIVEALSAIQTELRSRRLQKILTAVEEDVQAGLPLSRSLENSGIFPPHAVSLISIGESSGKLVDNLKVIAAEQQKDRVLRSKIRSATMYPVFVLSLTLVIGISIAWFILPKLATVFSQLKLELPALTKALIGLGTFLGEHGAVAVPVFFISLTGLIFILFFWKHTKFVGESILFAIPGIARFIKETELSRFGYLLGTLLSAGLSPTEALHSLSEAATLSRYRAFYAYLRDSVTEGNSFKKSFAQFPKSRALVPAPVQQLIIAGERSGTLSETLTRIGETYETKTDTTAKDLTVVLEPILLVIVWLGVVSVALAVILPIYSLIGGLNNPEPVGADAAPAQETQQEIVTETAAELPETVLPAAFVQVASDGLTYLNVRGEPSDTGEILGRLFPGEQAQVIEEQNGWMKILLPDGRPGWVLSEYVQTVEPPLE